MPTVLVTGAEGFAGSCLIDLLRQRGYEVVAGVRNRGRKLSLERRATKALVCDVSDAINVARVVASTKPDGIIHLAGTSRPFAAACEPLEAYHSIVSGWANVLDAARRSVPRAKLVMVSACDVYGDAGANGQPIDEQVPANPVTTFGALKANAESIARTFFRNYHVDVSIARPFHHTGPGQPEQFYFGAVAERVARWDGETNDGTLRLPDLDFSRDLLHVQDVAEAYLALLQHGKPNEAYNICSGNARTCREWVECIIAASGRSIRLSDLAAASDGEQPIRCLRGDHAKITSHTGWRPTRRAEDALSELLRGYQGQSLTRRELARA